MDAPAELVIKRGAPPVDNAHDDGPKHIVGLSEHPRSIEQARKRAIDMTWGRIGQLVPQVVDHRGQFSQGASGCREAKTPRQFPLKTGAVAVEPKMSSCDSAGRRRVRRWAARTGYYGARPLRRSHSASQLFVGDQPVPFRLG